MSSLATDTQANPELNPSNTAKPTNELTAEEKEKRKAAKKAAKLAKKQAKAAKLAAKKAKNNWNLDGNSKKAKAKANKAKKKKENEVKFVNLTPPGDKKDCTQELAKDYNPDQVEAAWNEWWESEGYFKPEFKFKDNMDEYAKLTKDVFSTFHQINISPN